MHAPLQGAVWSCKLNNPGMLGVTGSADFSARLWDALTGDEKCVWHHKHIVRTVDFANDCHRVATGGALLHSHCSLLTSKPASKCMAAAKCMCSLLGHLHGQKVRVCRVWSSSITV